MAKFKPGFLAKNKSTFITSRLFKDSFPPPSSACGPPLELVAVNVVNMLICLSEFAVVNGVNNLTFE